ncbi:transcription initiation factor IIA subunit 1 isoform X2 [Ischnura elegans]|nr:transcription initiation factor IIA subunit 1 isoform X2 [Ischnura elegans]XP_046387445.1 transcription initiation factor IIA subunit 1 isoform X2 [Ischnura elegans]
MEDVIAGARELLLDDGVDEQVLMELRHIWETKLLSSKAIDMSPEPADPQPPIVTAHATTAANNPSHPLVVAPSSTGNHLQAVAGNAAMGNSQQQQLTTANTTTTTTNSAADANKTVPVQITLPPQAGSSDTHPRVLTIQVPASALHGNQLQSVLSGPVISATMALPLHLATSLLQQHVTTALQGQLQAGLSNAMAGSNSISATSMQQHVIGVKGGSSLGAKGGGMVGAVRQLDGTGDTSDDDDDDDDDDDEGEEEGEGKEEREEDDEEEDDEEDGEGGEGGEGGAEEEPLNSEDDVSDEDPTDLFDTDNVVVCQYDKITRSRNKWKFYLKDGIMNLGGKDFVFQRANGDAEW